MTIEEKMDMVFDDRAGLVIDKLTNAVFDKETGEVLDTEVVPYNHDTKPYTPPYDKSKVTSKKDIEDYFREEINNTSVKVRWTNWAMDELFNIDPQTAYKFKLLAELIITRNIVFETTEYLTQHLGIKKSYVNNTLKTLKDCGLIREYKGHSGGRKMRYLELNPTLVFKTYQQYDAEKKFSSGSRFNTLHEAYVDKWLAAYNLNRDSY